MTRFNIGLAIAVAALTYGAYEVSVYMQANWQYCMDKQIQSLHCANLIVEALDAGKIDEMIARQVNLADEGA